MQTEAWKRITFLGAKTIALYSNDNLEHLQEELIVCYVYEIYHIMGNIAITRWGFEKLSLKDKYKKSLLHQYFLSVFFLLPRINILLQYVFIRHVFNMNEIKIAIFIYLLF